MSYQQTYPKRMAKENSPNTKELIKEETLKHQKGQKKHDEQKYA